MTIGELLKQKRLENEKTQKDWVGTIVSPSYYAKVEKDIHRISADDLLALLKYNDVSISNFFKQLDADLKSKETYWSHQAITATYNNDIEQLKKIRQEIKDSDLPNERKDIIILEIEGNIESVRIDLNPKYQPRKDFTKKLKNKIFSIPEVTELKLSLYGNFLFFYDHETNAILLKQLLKNIDFENTDNKMLLAIGAIINNYVSQSMEQNHYDGLDYYLDFTNHFPKSPELYLLKTSLSVLKSILHYHFTQDPQDIAHCETIIQTYMLTGLETFGKSSEKFINQEIEKVKRRS